MRAFTLMEVLAVVVLLAIGASVATVSLAGASDAAAAERAISLIRDADARARLLSARGQAVSLQVSDRTRIIVVTENGDRRTYDFADSSRLYLLDHDDHEITSVHFDARGRSQDYTVMCQSNTGTQRVRFAGLTGWSTVERETSP